MMYLTQNTIYLYTHMCLVTADSLWPMNCSSPGSSVHGIFQARILEWVAISFSCTHTHTHTHTHIYEMQAKELRLRPEYLIYSDPSSQGYGLSSSHVWMWELDCEESWAPKNWCFWTVVLEKTLESPLDCKEVQPVHSKGDQSWVFFGRDDAKAETPILWPPHAKSCHWKRLWCWEGLGAGGEGDNRGWDGWMASLTRWAWVWVNSRSRWWTGRPGVLQFMGSQSRTRLSDWTELIYI